MDRDIQALADALGTILRTRHGVILEATSCFALFGDLEIELAMTVLSSVEVEGGHAVLLRLMGDLAVVAISGDDTVQLGVLDTSRLDHPAEQLFEDQGPADLAEIYALVHPGEVRWFIRDGEDDWQEDS
jgi:hypothetical protein